MKTKQPLLDHKRQPGTAGRCDAGLFCVTLNFFLSVLFHQI
ncbi:hypothetical protein B4145_3884 [Bacillus subtilis]|uniref:Uncharacterized protein n=2 Tax=Bacillus subtilis TaxID=1423 RepID=A0AAP1E7K9_BACIU|nr:hypothetical protein B4067_3988 [Bacillus subtilis subsp. subtilis]KIN32651.1 hypothetical protein B4068_3559 [Bacillus subtilis]KIN57687.1 hypothetical protein B4145_3884 [Bacillus subtilis]KZD92459.1 hypothetical protein B4122_1798 [Bacillus subtilis]